MADIAKIKANVNSMVQQNAPEADIDAYLNAVGVSASDLRAEGRTWSEYGKGTLNTILDQGVQGVTSGFGDELMYGVDRLMGTPKDKATATWERFQDKLARQQEDYTTASIASNVAGGIGTGLLGAVGVAKAAPGVAKGIGQYAASHPYIASSLAGTVQGGLYGAGTGTDAADRVSKATTGGILGGTLGPAFTYLGRLIGGPISSSLGSGSNKADDITARTDPETLGSISGQPISNTPALPDIGKKATGRVLNLPAGAVSKDVNVMRAEEMARQGVLGQKLQDQITSADENVSSQALSIVQSLAGKDAPVEADDAFLTAIGKTQEQFKNDKKVMQGLMKQRNELINAAQVDTALVRDSLGKQVNSATKLADNVILYQQKTGGAPLRERVRVLNNILKTKEDTLDFNNLTAWATDLWTFARNNKGKQEGVVANNLKAVYDDWLENSLIGSLKSGDEGLAQKIREANKAYAGFKTKYGTDAYEQQSGIFEKLVNSGDLTPRQMVHGLMGSGLSGKDASGQIVDRMIKVDPTVKGDILQGLYLRAFEKANDGGNFSLQKMAKNLEQLQKNDVYRMVVDKEQDDITSNLVKDLFDYTGARNRRDVVNASGTAPTYIRFMQMMGSVPMTGGAAEATAASAATLAKITKSVGNRTNKSLVRASLKKFAENMEKSAVPKSYGPLLGGTVGAQVVNQTQPLMGTTDKNVSDQ